MLAGSRYVSSPLSEREMMVLPVHTTPTCAYKMIIMTMMTLGDYGIAVGVKDNENDKRE